MVLGSPSLTGLIGAMPSSTLPIPLPTEGQRFLVSVIAISNGNQSQKQITPELLSTADFSIFIIFW